MPTFKTGSADAYFETEQHLDCGVCVDAWPTALARSGCSRIRQYALVDPHRYIPSINQTRVVFRPVPDAVHALRLARLAFVPAHLSAQKARIYAIRHEVNSDTVASVARKRQPDAQQPDLCNNAAYAVGLVVMYIYAGLRFDVWSSPIGHFEFELDLRGNSILKILAALFLMLGVSFFAFGEELYLRGWMTQTLGQHIRVPVVVVIIVAGAFALLHTQYTWLVKLEMFLAGLGFSILSLRDRRLELAVGAHSASNIWIWLKGIIYTGQRHLDFHILFTDYIVFDLIKTVLPVALIYLFFNATNGWFVFDNEVAHPEE